MSQETKKTLKCPICSERCRIIDLGNWASEKYVIPAPLQSSDLEGESDEIE